MVFTGKWQTKGIKANTDPQIRPKFRKMIEVVVKTFVVSEL